MSPEARPVATSFASRSNGPMSSARGPHLAVGAIVVHGGALLMVQRAEPPAAGKWSVPGGRVEAGEWIVDAVRREVLEETGLKIEVAELAGIFEVPGDPHYVVMDYLATVLDDSPPRAADDAAAVAWVPLEDISSLQCTPRLVEALTAWGVLAATGGSASAEE